jgi:hypothetical protein
LPFSFFPPSFYHPSRLCVFTYFWLSSLPSCELPMQCFPNVPTSCQFRFRRRCRLDAGDSRSAQVCFRHGVKKITSAPRELSTGYELRLTAQQQFLETHCWLLSVGQWGRTDDSEPVHILKPHSL